MDSGFCSAAGRFSGLAFAGFVVGFPRFPRAFWLAGFSGGFASESRA